MTQKQKREIENSYYQLTNREFGPWEDDGHHANNRYYGEENGYIILLHGGIEYYGANYQQLIGDYKFVMESGQIFTLYAYKDGAFHLLADAYKQGLISDAAIKAAWEIHCNYN